MNARLYFQIDPRYCRSVGKLREEAARFFAVAFLE